MNTGVESKRTGREEGRQRGLEAQKILEATTDMEEDEKGWRLVGKQGGGVLGGSGEAKRAQGQQHGASLGSPGSGWPAKLHPWGVEDPLLQVHNVATASWGLGENQPPDYRGPRGPLRSHTS